MRLSYLRSAVGSSLLLAGCGSVADSTPDAKDNVAAPANERNAGTVDEGGQMSLTGNLVSTDPDSSNASLVYTVLTLPEDGTLKADDIEVTVGGTFTQKDIIDGDVTYVHNGKPDGGDSFDWELTDGVHALPQSTFAITVTPTNDAPIIVTNETNEIAEGGSYVLTPARLSTSDEEGGTITYTFVSAQRGQLQRRVGAGPFVALNANETFTVQDIADGNLKYVDPGTDDAMLALQQSTTASFSWRVQDAEGAVAPSATGAFVSSFTITSVDDAPTVLWRTQQCGPAGNNFAINPLKTLTDVDNATADYSVCIVSISTGDTVTGTSAGSTITQIPLVVQNGLTNLAVNSCIPANALTNLNVDSAALSYRGAITWRLMKGATQIGLSSIMGLPIQATACP